MAEQRCRLVDEINDTTRNGRFVTILVFHLLMGGTRRQPRKEKKTNKSLYQHRKRWKLRYEEEKERVQKKRQQESNARLRGMGSIMMRFFSHLFELTKHARHQLEEWFSLCGVD